MSLYLVIYIFRDNFLEVKDVPGCNEEITNTIIWKIQIDKTLTSVRHNVSQIRNMTGLLQATLIDITTVMYLAMPD